MVNKNNLIAKRGMASDQKDWYEIVIKVYVTITVQVNKYKE